MMRSLAQEVAAERIRGNAIAPSAIRTALNQSAWRTKEAAERLLTLIPTGASGEPEDVARAAVWLASDFGTTLFVDGGLTFYRVQHQRIALVRLDGFTLAAQALLGWFLGPGRVVSRQPGVPCRGGR